MWPALSLLCDAKAWREHCESLCKPLEEIRKDISKASCGSKERSCSLFISAEAKLGQDFVYLGSGCDEIDKASKNHRS